MTIHWKAVEQYFAEVLFVFQFHPVCNVLILENVSILDSALSRVKEFSFLQNAIQYFIVSFSTE